MPTHPEVLYRIYDLLMRRQEIAEATFREALADIHGDPPGGLPAQPCWEHSNRESVEYCAGPGFMCPDCWEEHWPTCTECAELVRQDGE